MNHMRSTWLVLMGLWLSALDTQAASDSETIDKVSVSAEGLVANLYIPRARTRQLPGVLVLGGSEGGLGEGSAIESRLIAEQGYAVLHLAYFDVAGRPKALEALPLEYFKTAIDWLGKQSSVDAKRLGIVGTSKGAEAALLTASHYPQIKVVIAGAPSSVVWPGIRGTRASSWTLNGEVLPALPYGLEDGFKSIYALYQNGLKKLDQYSSAIIKVEQINGPVMLICGEADALWPSCTMSRQIEARLKERRFSHAVQLSIYDDAGHAAFGPPVPQDSERYLTLDKMGGSSKGNNAAREDSWRTALGFLDSALKR